MLPTGRGRTDCEEKEKNAGCPEEHREWLMQDGASALIRSPCGEKEKARESGSARSVEMTGKGDNDAGGAESDEQSEESPRGLVVA
jgi:hypothetical protein